MIETPRTDAHQSACLRSGGRSCGDGRNAYWLARQLERENIKMRVALDEWNRLKEWLEMDGYIRGYMMAESEAFKSLMPPECEECEGTGKRSLYECDELVDCVDCNGTGKQTLASESQRIAAGTADEKSDGQAENKLL